MTGARFQRLGEKRSSRFLGFWLAFPAILCMAVVIAYPVIKGVAMSFTNMNLLRGGDGSFCGLANYRAMFKDPYFLLACRNTAIWTIANVAIQMALGIIAAVSLNGNAKGQGVYRTLIMIPWIVPSVVPALTWRWMFDWSNGIVNAALLKLGLIAAPVAWLGNTKTAMPAVVLASAWKGLPFVTMMLLAALQPIPKELYEAASIDGAGFWQTLTRITIPVIKRTIAVATVLTTIFTVNNFNAIWLMTQGGPLYRTEILFTYAYKIAFQKFNFGLAASISTVLFLLLSVFGAVYLYLMDKEEA